MAAHVVQHLFLAAEIAQWPSAAALAAADFRDDALAFCSQSHEVAIDLIQLRAQLRDVHGSPIRNSRRPA